MLWLFLGSHIVWSNFDLVSNVIRDCCVCALLRSMIGPENLRHSLNQLDAELLFAWSSAFSHALGSLIIFIARSHWLSGYFPFFLFSFFFFSRTSRGHNALPRLGLEPGLSDSEPSALTTGLLDKAVALAYPRYSWPSMLKVAPCTVVRSYIQIFSAWWVATILYNYGATLCELRYYFVVPCEFCQP